MRIFQPVHSFFHWFLSLRWRNKIILCSTAIAVVAVVIWRYRISTAAPPYILEKVTRGSVIQRVSETGHIRSTAKTDIYSPATGIVETVSIHNADTVRIGQELFTVRSTATEQEKALAWAAYLSAKNTLDTAQTTFLSLQSTMFSKWKTYKELAEGDAYENSDGTPRHDQRANPIFHIAEKDWLAAEGNFKKQQDVIAQAQAALSSSYLLYQATQNSVVKATANGTVANLGVAIGDTVSAKTTVVTPKTPALLIVTDTAETVIRLSINEVDIPKIMQGQQASITIDAIPDTTFSGTVSAVDSVGTEDQGIITYIVLVSLSDANPAIRPGMTANVDIEVDTAENVLVVSNAAIKPYQGKKAVQILDPETKKPTYVPVEIGRKSTDKTEIVSGISEGQEIISGIKNGAVNGSRSGFFAR